MEGGRRGRGWAEGGWAWEGGRREREGGGGRVGVGGWAWEGVGVEELAWARWCLSVGEGVFGASGASVPNAQTQTGQNTTRRAGLLHTVGRRWRLGASVSLLRVVGPMCGCVYFLLIRVPSNKTTQPVSGASHHSAVRNTSRPSGGRT